MANLYITEFEDLGVDGKGTSVPVGKCPPVAQQKLTYTGTSAASNDFDKRTRYIRVTADADAHLEFGSSPTATNAKLLLPSGSVEYFAVNPETKVAAIETS